MNKEKVDWTKFFKGFFNVIDPVEWLKTLHAWLNLRNVIIGLVIFILVYNFAYSRGIGGKAVKFDLRGQEVMISLNEHALHIRKDGSAVVLANLVDPNINGEYIYTDDIILKNIEVKDIPELRKALKPIGFQIKPIVIAGVGVGETTLDENNTDMEFGAGVSWFKIHSFNADAFITNQGVYPLAVSKKLNILGMKNTAIGAGVGKGWQNAEGRLIGYLRWEW